MDKEMKIAFEYDIISTCNLNCEGCTHYASIGNNDVLSIENIVNQLGLGDCMHGTHMTADKIKSIAFEILNNPDKTKAVHEFKLQMKQSMNVVDAANVIENFYQKEVSFLCENVD